MGRSLCYTSGGCRESLPSPFEPLEFIAPTARLFMGVSLPVRLGFLLLCWRDFFLDGCGTWVVILDEQYEVRWMPDSCVSLRVE